MNQDQVEGTARKVAGRVEDAAGALAGDANTRASGKARQILGDAQKTYGSAIESVQNFTKDSPLAALGIVAGIAFLLGIISARR